MNLKDLFHRKRRVPVGSPDGEPQPLRIEGIDPAPLTPEPDDTELAAQALLEMMSESLSLGHSPKGDGSKKTSKRKGNAAGSAPVGSADGEKPCDATYYRQLADRMRQAHEAATQRTMRFVAFCEQELKKPDLPAHGPGSLALLEAELYKRLDVIERRGGDLKRRWQHCLATVVVRLMKHSEDTETTDDTDSSD